MCLLRDWLAVWLSGSVVTVGHINEVTLRRAGLVLRWVTVLGYTVSVFNQATQANSACYSSVGGIMSTDDCYGYRRVLRNIRPCYIDCWHTDLVG